MKLCDLTQFYSPVSGGVKRYIAEKVKHVREHTPDCEHILIVPGEQDKVVREERSRVYTIRSPLVARSSRYRALVRLEAVEEILEKERPSLIESGDPYQVAWKAVHSGEALRIPVVGFYHSHFPEAYLRTAQKYLGKTATEFLLDFSKRYIRHLYNRFERTIVSSPALAALLENWGVENTFHIDLGVDVAVFRPEVEPGEDVRSEYSIHESRKLLLYVGRLAHEKNTHTLFDAFRRIAINAPDQFHLMIVGDGMQRREMEDLRTQLAVNGQKGKAGVTWLPYCSDPRRLAQLYRAADLFVHPGVQETFGLVALEAQACGTAVIGIRGSYMDRIIHCDQTLWANGNSAEELSCAILDTGRRQPKSDGERLSRHVHARYSWVGVFGRLFDLYREVIAQYGATQ